MSEDGVAGKKKADYGFAGRDDAAKMRIEHQSANQEEVDAIIREAVQVARATKKANGLKLEEKELFNDSMNRQLAKIRKRCHAKWKETKELALIEDINFSNWTSTQELKGSVKLEGWGTQFFPTHYDQL